MIFVTGVVVVLCVCILGFLWMRGSRGRVDSLRDAGVSTLVFPPQPKFQASGFPRH